MSWQEHGAVPYPAPAMPLLIDTRCDCAHPHIEHLGNDHDAQFFRCEQCGYVFVTQGGVTLGVPAVQPRTFDRTSSRAEDAAPVDERPPSER